MGKDLNQKTTRLPKQRNFLLYGNTNMALINILVFRPFQLQQKEKTNSGYKHNNKVSHGIFNLTFRMLQHTSSEVTVTKSDEI